MENISTNAITPFLEQHTSTAEEMDTEEEQFTQNSTEQCEIDDGADCAMTADTPDDGITEDTPDDGMTADTPAEAPEDVRKRIYGARSPYFGKNTTMSFDFQNFIQFKYCHEGKIKFERNHSVPLNMQPYEIIEQNNDTSTNQPSQSDGILPSECLTVAPETLTEEQTSFVSFIREEIESMLLPSGLKTSCVLLTGCAGTGKTSTLVAIRGIEKSNILYIANTKSLCSSTGRKFNVNTMNFCKFVMSAYGVGPDVALKLIKQMQEQLDINLQYDINSYFFERIFPDEDFVEVIFLDEFSMFSPLALKEFIAIFQAASNKLDKKFLLILCGDFKHIPLTNTDFKDYKPIVDMCKEPIFDLKKQLRIADVNYCETIMKLTDKPLINSELFLNELIAVIPQNSWGPLINYKYPIDYIEKYYDKLKSSTDLKLWLNTLEADFFSKVLSLKAFAFENKEVHYMNLSLGLTILSQLIKLGKTADFNRSFVLFDLFSSATNRKLHVCEKSMTLPLLPLIRFFPYRLLVNTRYIPNGSIVYLINWNYKAKNVTVYYPYDKEFLIIGYQEFCMNLYNQHKLYGFPLELAFASTFHKVQGGTVTEDIAVSLKNIDHRELFAILSRIRSREQIKHLYFRP